MSVDAFVSYATPDREITMALVEDLEARGLKCWVAPRDVPGGSKYAEVILNALAESKVFLLVFSENSNNSEHVQREVERALNSSKTIVPVRIADVFPSGAMDYYLATLHWIDAFGAAKEGSFNMVADAMAGVLGRELIDPDEVVGSDAMPALAGGGDAADNFSTDVPPAASAEPKTVATGVDAKSSSDPAKSKGVSGGMIAVGVAALMAVGGVVAWKAVDWGGGDDDAGGQAVATGGGETGDGEGKSAGSDGDADDGKIAKVDGDDRGASGGQTDGGKSTTVVETKVPDKTTLPKVVGVAAAGTGVDPKIGVGSMPKNGNKGVGNGPQLGAEPPVVELTEEAVPLVANANVNLAGQNTDLIVAPGGLPVIQKSTEGDAGTKIAAAPKSTQPDPTMRPEPEPVPSDPVADAIAAAQKAWQAGERKLARESWLELLQSPAGKDLDADKLGEDGVKLLSEMVMAAAEDANGGGSEGAAASAFAELDEWKGLVVFSEQLGLDALVAQREGFLLGWQVAQAESQWTSGSREGAAKSLAEIAGLGNSILERMKREGDFVGTRLLGLLDEVTKTAAEGRLGTSEVLSEQWGPSLQLAADSGDFTATGVLATLAWKADDRKRTAEILEDYEVATRGSDSLDAGVATLLGQALTKAQAEMVAAAAGDDGKKPSSLLTAAWEPAFNIAYRHELPGALEVVAEVTHRRDPGEAVALYRRLYQGATEGGSLRKRISFCLQMLERYDLGDESKFYRGELQDACELTLDTIGQPATGGELIEEIPEIREAADAGVPAAQYIMADLTANGKGVERDDKVAFAFYKKASDGGYARAKYAVGECLRDGRGTEKDIAEAVRLWRSMEEDEVAEVPQALFNLAELLPEGAEQTALYTEARKHYAAKVEGGRLAMYGGGLGFMQVVGWGGPAEPKAGYELLRKAAEQGSSYAAFRAGFILTDENPMFAGIREGAGISLDVKTGTELMKQAARDGYTNAVIWCEQNGVDIAE